MTYDEGLCVQCIHIGSCDDEPATVSLMYEFMERQGYKLDINDTRMHHEPEQNKVDLDKQMHFGRWK